MRDGAQIERLAQGGVYAFSRIAATGPGRQVEYVVAVNNDTAGKEVTGGRLHYGGSPVGYTAAHGEAVTYVDAHDNETLFDALAYKLPAGARRRGRGAAPGAGRRHRPGRQAVGVRRIQRRFTVRGRTVAVFVQS